MTLKRFCQIILLTVLCGYTGFNINPVWTPISMLIGLLISFIIF